MDQFIDKDREYNQKEREQARSQLAEKLERLETRVHDNVEQVKDAVRHSTDLKYQVDKRPWTMLGLAVIAGCAAGRLLLAGRQPSFGTQIQSAIDGLVQTAGKDARKSYEALPTIQLEPYRKQLGVLKNASLGALTAVAAEMARHFLPAVLAQVEQYYSGKHANGAVEKMRETAGRFNDNRKSSV